MKGTYNLRAAIATLVLLAGNVATAPAFAVSDSKSVSPMECLPRGPGTSFSELTYGPYGITNPGTTSETVICPIPGDGESAWSSTAGGSAYLFVWYRIGSVPGNISCTAFTGTAVTGTHPTYSVTHTTPTEGVGTRAGFYMDLADTSGFYGFAPPAVLVCTLSPKAALGWVFFRETIATNTP